MNTQTKIAAALLLVLLTALTTTATLGYFIYERTLSSLVTSRFEFIARELKRKVEAGLDLGLPLGELENMNALLRQEKLTDDALVALTIQNAKGTILFATETSRIGTRPDSSWLDTLIRPEVRSSDIFAKGSDVAVPLVNSFGKVVGGLIISFSETYYDDKRAATMLRVAEITIAVLLFGSLVGLWGVLTISRPLEYAVVRLEASLRTLLVRMGLAADVTSPDTDLEAEIVTFERNVLTAVSALERAQHGVIAGQHVSTPG